MRLLKVNPITAYLSRLVGRRLTSDVKSFIFVATTGRSGTHSLQKVLSVVENAVSLHEPDPVLHGAVMKQYNEEDSAALKQQFKLRKLPNIYLSSLAKKHYIECNHVFIKSFSEEIFCAFGSRLKVIHLTRDPIEVASSYYLRNCIPGKDNQERPNLSGNKWLIDPLAKRNLITINDFKASHATFSHDYYKLLWYWYETEARLLEFHHRHPTVPIIPFTANALNDYQALADLFEKLGFVVSPQLQKVIGVRESSSGGALPLPDGISSAQVQKFISLCEKKLNSLKSVFAV